MTCFIRVDGSRTLHFYDGHELHALSCPDEAEAINRVHRALHGRDLPTVELGSAESPYGARLLAAISRRPAFETMTNGRIVDYRTLEQHVRKVVSEELGRLQLPDAAELADEVAERVIDAIG